MDYLQGMWTVTPSSGHDEEQSDGGFRQEYT